MMAVAVQSNLDTALYSMVVKEHALLNISINLEIHASGVIQETASVHGQIVTVLLVMTMISAHVKTPVAMASVLPLLSLVTLCVSTVMATAAV